MSKFILDLHPLEARENPAGSFTSSLVGSTLVLTGTDNAESIVIKDDGVGMTINGQAGTVIDGVATKTFAQAVNSVRIVARGGDDTVALDQTTPLSLSGQLNIDLGTSRTGNTFNLTTPLAITLGSVRLTGGSGPDTANFGGSTASVAGDFAANFGAGNGQLTVLSGGAISGNLSMTAGVGYNHLTISSSTISKNVTYSPGDGDSDLDMTGSTITGNVNLGAGRGNDQVRLDNVTIAGLVGLTVSGGNGDTTLYSDNIGANITRGGMTIRSTNNDATLNVNGALTVAKSTTISGRRAFTNTGADFQTNSFTMTGPYGSSFLSSGGTIKFNGNARFSSLNDTALFSTSGGSLDARGSFNVSGRSASLFMANGTNSVTVAGDINVVASSRLALFGRSGNWQYTFGGNLNVRGNEAGFSNNDGYGQYSKNVTITALADQLLFSVVGTVTFVQNVTITGNNGADNVTINSRTAEVLGNLSINTGNNDDTVTITGARISGAANIQTGDGEDTIQLDDGVRLNGVSVIDAGNGDDLLQFAQSVGLNVNAVEFVGKATIRAGAGNDQLQLGLSVANMGDGFSLANFNTAGSSVDGGANLNSFDDETGQSTGTPMILNWTDPTP